MASFYEQPQGENGLDMLVQQLQQQRDNAEKQRIQNQKEAAAQQQYKLTYGNKLLGDPDLSGEPYSNLYNNELERSKQRLISLNDMPLAEYGNAANEEALRMAGLANKIQSYKNAANQGAERVKALGGDPVLYKDLLANRTFTHDGSTVKHLEDIDLDGAVKYLDNNKYLFYPNPEANLNTYFANIEKLPGEFKDSDKKMVDGSRQSTQYNFTTKPGISQFNPKTGLVDMVYQPVTDDYGRPIDGRKMIGDQLWNVLQQTPGAYNSLEAYLKKVNPNIDPNSIQGKQLMRELVYPIAEQHKGFVTKQITNDVQGDPYKQQLEQGRLAAQQQQAILRDLEIQIKQNAGNVKNDDFSQNWKGIISNNPNVITTSAVPMTIGSPYGGNVYNGAFGSTQKTVDAFPVSSTFNGGRYAIGINQEDGKKIYAKEIYRIPNGLVIENEDGSKKVLNTSKDISGFIHQTAPLNGSTPLKAGNIIDNSDVNADTPLKPQSKFQKTANAVKKVFGLGGGTSPKSNTNDDDFNQYKRK